ncbi:MAG: AlpA family phage regulatory protein [Pseudomonadota bacterium]|nr:AlpA family phage regulatory protein [Pseudomonadota bacterium]
MKRVDFDQLSLGRFVDAAPNDPARRHSPTGARSTLGVRFAGPWTFNVWSELPVAELWQWIALASFLDPSTVPVDTVLVSNVRRHSAVGLFRDRLLIAGQLAQLGGMDCLNLAADVKRSLVRLDAFTDWAAAVELPLPESFPKPSPKRAQRKPLATADGPLVRLKDILPMLPFSAATLWRRVKDGAFPAPTKISRGVTAWRRDAVEAWLAEQIAPDGQRPRAKKVASSS